MRISAGPNGSERECTRGGRTSSCCGVHKDPLARLRLRPRHKCSIRRRSSDVQARRLVEAHLVRHLNDGAPVDLDLLGVGALSCAKDARLARNVGAALRDGRVGRHDAGELAAGDPGEGGLVLVLPLHLEDCAEAGECYSQDRRSDLMKASLAALCDTAGLEEAPERTQGARLTVEDCGRGSGQHLLWLLYTAKQVRTHSSGLRSARRRRYRWGPPWAPPIRRGESATLRA